MLPYFGHFLWYELMTTDAPEAQAFYEQVIGWTAQDSSANSLHGDYTVLLANQTMVAGLMPLPEAARQMGARPAWMGYIGVDDVDSYCERVQAAGGSVHKAPSDIPQVGRFAVVADPHHAAFILFAPQPGMDGSSAQPSEPGHVGWHELYAGELDSAWAFYETLFGWTKADAMDMGPGGLYQMFMIQDTVAGGMMKRPPEAPASYWQYYINVASIKTAIERVKLHGGQVLNGPMQVPGGSWIVHAMDPQGAMFALIGPSGE